MSLLILLRKLAEFFGITTEDGRFITTEDGRIIDFDLGGQDE